MLPEGLPAISKAVISLWFRVPLASLEAAAAEEVPDDLEGDINDYVPAFHQVIPRLTFGSLETATTDLGYGSGANPVAPSFIGVDCSPKAVMYMARNHHVCHQGGRTTMFTPVPGDAHGPRLVAAWTSNR